MSVNAIVSKECPAGIVYLVPGRIAMNSNPIYSLAPSAEEEIVVDAMPASGISTLTYINPAITLTFLEQVGCGFLTADEHNSW